MPVKTRSQAAAAAHRRGSAAPDPGHDGGARRRRGNLTHRRRRLAEDEAEDTERHGSLAPGPVEEEAGVLRENVAPPEAPAPSKNNGAVVFASEEEPQERENVACDAMSCADKEATGYLSLGGDGVEGKLVAAGEVGAGNANDALVRELQMKVKALEAEIERMKEAHLLQLKQKAVNDDSEAARAERRVVTRSRLPKKQRGCAAAETHISSLGDDLVLEILLRLPSLATLVRAACTCRAWRRAVASSPAFRRSFRALHPPPLLGFIFQAYDSTPAPNVAAFPAFVPARPRDKDLVAAIRGGDFFYTSLLNRTKEGRCWEMLDVCRGYVLLANWAEKLLAVFNPLTRQSEHVFDLVSQSQDTLEKYHGLTVTGVLLWPDEESMSFRVCLFAHDDSKIQFSFFTSDTGMWSVTPWVDFPVRPDGDVERSLLDRSFVGENGFLYWVYIDCRYIILLDTATMEFSVAELPQCVSRNFDVGHTKDRKACIVYADGFNIGVLMHTKEGDGVDRWVLDRVVPMDTDLEQVLPVQFDDDSELNVLDVRDGYVYLATSKMFHDPVKPCWFMILCLETMKLEVLFQRTFDNIIRPYTMAWPPLLGNFGRLALEDAP